MPQNYTQCNSFCSLSLSLGFITRPSSVIISKAAAAQHITPVLPPKVYVHPVKGAGWGGWTRYYQYLAWNKCPHHRRGDWKMANAVLTAFCSFLEIRKQLARWHSVEDSSFPRDDNGVRWWQLKKRTKNEISWKAVSGKMCWSMYPCVGDNLRKHNFDKRHKKQKQPKIN